MSNLLLTILVARSSSVREFAGFALTFPVYVVAQRLTRVFLLVPRQITAARSGELDPAVSPVASAALLSGSLFGAGCLTAAALASGANPWLLVIGLSLPGLMVYEQLRYECIIVDKYRRVTVLDGTWLISQAGLSVVVLVMNLPMVWNGVAWGIFPTLCAVANLSRYRPSARAAYRLVRSRLRAAGDALTDLLANVLIIQALPYLVAVFASLNAAAGVRGGQTLLGPVNVAVMGMIPLIQHSSAEAGAVSSSAVRRVLHEHLVLTGVLTIPYAVILMLLPDSVGISLLGPTWSVTRVVIIGLCVHLVVRTPALLCVTTLRSLGAMKPVVTARFIMSALLVTGAYVGCTISTPAIAWGMATSGLLGSCAAYGILRHYLSHAPVTAGHDSSQFEQGMSVRPVQLEA